MENAQLSMLKTNLRNDFLLSCEQMQPFVTHAIDA